MATTVLRLNLNDLTAQFVRELKAQVGKRAQVELKLEDTKHGEGLFSEADFWGIIDLLDWSKKRRDDVLKPAAEALSKKPISAIFLFHDLLSERLFWLDTRQHADSFRSKQADEIFSVDEFLYTRCAVIAEGKIYFEEVLNDAFLMPGDIDFEHLLGLAEAAHKLKTGRVFDYSPLFSFETKSNLEGWKK